MAHANDACVSLPRSRALAAFAGLALAACSLASGAALAQGYPDNSRILKFSVPSGPGSTVDLLARAFERALPAVTGIKAVVENKPGADAVIGVQAFLQTPADGYNALFVSSSFVAVSPAILPDLPYDPLKDLQPIASISRAGLVMNLGVSTPFRTMREFVAAAKAQPGKYTCATASTTQTLACEFLQASAGVKLLVVPYRTTAAAMLAVSTGEADSIFVDPGSAIAQWGSGRVRGVVSTTPERQAALPDMPTTKEEGFPDFQMIAWFAIFAKAGTPPEAAAGLREIMRKAAQRPEVQSVLKTFVHEPTDLGVAELAKLNADEIAALKKLIKDHNISFTR